MGKPDVQSASGDIPHTRCSNCETVFEVSSALLSSADTRVRCGECLSIFDALACLCSLPPDLAVVGSADNPNSDNSAVTRQASGNANKEASAEGFDNEDFYSSRAAAQPEGSAERLANRKQNAGQNNDLDSTFADFDLFSGDAELPEVAYFEQTSDLPGAGLDDVEDDHDETFSDTLFVRDAAVELEANSELHDAHEQSLEDIEEVVEDVEPKEDLVFNYQESEAQKAPQQAPQQAVRPAGPSPRKSVPDKKVVSEGFLSSSKRQGEKKSNAAHPWVFRLLLGLSLILLLGALFSYRHRDNMHNSATMRPLLVGVCSVFGCSVPARVEIGKLKLLSRSVTTHPDIEGALIIKLAFRNEAPFEQRYPVLVIRLSDTVGRVVARRNFPPSDYSRNWKETNVLGIGERVDVALDIRDPGRNAMSFELDFQEY